MNSAVSTGCDKGFVRTLCGLEVISREDGTDGCVGILGGFIRICIQAEQLTSCFEAYRTYNALHRAAKISSQYSREIGNRTNLPVVFGCDFFLGRGAMNVAPEMSSRSAGIDLDV